MPLPFLAAASIATQRNVQLAYIPTPTRSAVAPPGSVPAGTVCVSPTGTPSGDGTPGNPYDFVTGNAALTDGGTLMLFDGIYTLVVPPNRVYFGKDDQTLQTTVKAQTGARPILTATDGGVIYPVLKLKTTVDGIWFGGAKGASAELQHGNNCIVQNCTFFNYLEAINEGAATNSQYLNNRFVNNGDGFYSHDIYINNSTRAVGESAIIRGGIHVGGEGYKIHLWHQPKYTTVQNNFCDAPGFYDIVIDGDGHTVDHNIVWNYRLWINVATNTTVTKNIGGPTADIAGPLGAGSTASGNIVTFGNLSYYIDTEVWPRDQWKTTTGYSIAEIDDTVNKLICAFHQSTANLWIDNGIEPLFAILAAVRDAVGALGSPPQAPQAAVVQPSNRVRGGIPLSRRHKAGRNRRRITRSRR